MEAPGGEPDFKYPGWTFEFDRGDDGNEFKLDEARRADGLLLGRRTYESFACAWPQRDGEFADTFNAMPKFVVSTTLRDPDWNNTTVLAGGDATAQVRRLKEAFDAPREPTDMAPCPARCGPRDSLGATKASTRIRTQKTMTAAMSMSTHYPLRRRGSPAIRAHVTRTPRPARPARARCRRPAPW